MDSNEKSKLAKKMMDEFVPTEQDLKDIAEHKDYMKRDLGSCNIELMLNEDTGRFDKRKFGKLSCPFCKHKFNPFYAKTLKQKDWYWVWRGTEYKEPESNCDVECTKCKEPLYFRVYVAQ